MVELSLCAVCQEAVDEAMSAECHSCGKRFHLNPRNDLEGKDCGAVWISEQHMALEFACQRCLDGSDSSPPPPSPAHSERPHRRRYRRRA